MTEIKLIEDSKVETPTSGTHLIKDADDDIWIVSLEDGVIKSGFLIYSDPANFDQTGTVFDFDNGKGFDQDYGVSYTFLPKGTKIEITA